MTTIGSLNVNLGLQSSQFTAGIQRASQQTAAATTAMQRTLGGATVAVKGLMAAFAVDRIASAVHSAFDYADAIDDLSKSTGFTTKTIQEFGYAAQISGSSVESARTGLAKFAKTFGEAQNGSQSAIKTLRALGVTSNDLETGFRQASDGAAKLDTRSQQLAATTSVMGKKAGDLTATFASGSAAMSELGAKAAELGIVLDKDVIASAGKANDELDTMKMILDAQFANNIVKNADAIASLADGVSKLAGGLIQFWAQNPQLAMTIMGALAGGAVGGLPGAAIGGVAGFAAGSYMKKTMDDGNNDIAFRQQKMHEARAAWNVARTTTSAEDSYAGERGGQIAGVGGSGAADAKAEFQRQIGLMGRALAAKKGGKAAPGGGGSGNLPGVTVPKSHGPTALELDAQYQTDMARANNELLSAKQALTSDIVEQSALEREMLANETTANKAQILADGPDGSKKLSAARVQELLLLEDKVEYAKADKINQTENEELARAALNIKTSGLELERDLLSGQSSLARTQAERRAIELRILDAKYEEERATLQAVKDSHTSSPDQKAVAEARLAQLDQLKSNEKAGVVNSTMGPMAAYLDGIPKTVGEIEESLESAAVNGLGALNDGLLEAIKGTGNLKDAFGNMASFIIDSLLKIALQKAIIEPLAGALFGGGKSGGGGGILGSIAGIFKKVAVTTITSGARANGGFTSPGSYLVGERGPEVVNVGNPSNVVSNDKLSRMKRGGGGMTINVDARGAGDPAAVEAAAKRAVQQAIPAIMPLSYDYANSRNRQPRM